MGFGRPMQAFVFPTTSLKIVEQPGGVVDSGTITIAFNGHSQSVMYGPSSTASSIAAAFAAKFSSYPASAWPRLCTAGVCAKANGPTVIFQSSGSSSFNLPVVTGPNTSFTVDTSAWLAAPFNQATPTVILTASANPLMYGQTITFSAAVDPSGSGGPTPTGSVTFYDAGNSIGSANLAGGVANFSPSSLSAGTHTITSTYNGDNNYLSGSSAALAEDVKYGPSLSLASSLNPSSGGQAVTFTATVTGSAQVAPNGTVDIYDGSTLLGSQTIASGSLSVAVSSTLTAGTHTITAYWRGDANYNSVTSNSVEQVVTGIQLGGPGIINTIVGNGLQGYTQDGSLAATAEIEGNAGRVVGDTLNNLYFCEWGSRIRKISSVTGILTTVAGNGTAGYSGDNGNALSAQIECSDLAIDSVGNIYFADFSDARIRKVSAATGQITTVAGNGTTGYSGDGGQATSAEISTASIVVDGSNNLYFLSVDSQGFINVRMVTASTGTISTLSYFGSTASVHQPGNIAVDNAGNIYVSMASYIYKLPYSMGQSTQNWIVIAGTGTAGHTGDGGSALDAEINPEFLISDTSGDLYFADTTDNVVREVNATNGNINIAAFLGGGYGCLQETDSIGDGCLAIDGIGVTQAYNSPNFSLPYLGIDSSGNIFVSVGEIRTLGKDVTNGVALRIRGIRPMLSTQVQSTTLTLICSPNPITYGSNSNCSTSIAPDATGTVSLLYANTSTNKTEFTPSVPITAGATNQNLPGTVHGGSNIVFATYNGDATHLPSVAATQLQINPTQQTGSYITWPPPSPISYGTALGLAQLGASSTIPGTFSYTPGFGTVLPVGQQNLSVMFSPLDTLDYSGPLTITQAIVVNANNPNLLWANPAPIEYGTPLTQSQLNAKADVPGTFTYNPAAGTVLPVGTQNLSVTFTPDESANNTSNAQITSSVQIVVKPDTPHIVSILPNPAMIGSTVTVFGRNFGPAQGAGTVTFNGVTASVSSWTDDAITTIIPAGANTGSVVVNVSPMPSNGFLLLIPATCP